MERTNLAAKSPEQAIPTHSGDNLEFQVETANETAQSEVSEAFSGKLTPTKVLSLQRTIGNRAVTRIMREKAGVIQRERTVLTGSQGNTVLKLQQKLNKLGMATPALAEDGIFGPKTLAAVLAFQKARKLVEDGIVGKKTWAELKGDEGSKDASGSAQNAAAAAAASSPADAVSGTAAASGATNLPKESAPTVKSAPPEVGESAPKETKPESPASKPTFKQQFEKELDSIKLDMAAITKLVNEASPAERQTVWSDATLMTKAFDEMTNDDYLTIVTKLRMFQVGTTAEDNKTHTSATDADKDIRDKLSAYVAGAVKAGRQIEGMVGVVGDSDWDRAGEAHYGHDVWFNGPPPKDPKKDLINGFVDSKDRVWIHKDRGNAGTMIHEGLHKYASDKILNDWNFDMNEGITEYFTRKIGKSLPTPIARGNYQEQLDVIEPLSNVVGEAVMAGAYFDGKLDEMKKKYLEFRKGKGDDEAAQEQSWKDFLKDMDKERYAAALRRIS
ncbi:MAG: peptidoglycan-binding protein [Chloroflexi bacterium]|uniref:Peptidoglycan-binding protein n=1 Tax=Candidatus Chlorohelix allophototropha TaxID=3003348 RepID=A0A8T7M9F3_9CHLR|nr:peptidoglycan-binding protein [Chloroflexota bacterium]WJW68625.1 peptidoglycan-binding protein [Chloroflexota bacterium L227-S17]